VTNRPSRASRSASSSRASRERADGRVDVACPQCGAQYRVTKDALEEKLECGDCHRVFFPKTTAGKRVAPTDYTKTYVGVGVGVVVLIALMVLTRGGGGEAPKPKPVAVAPTPTASRGNHPRAAMALKWAQAVASGNQLVLTTHSDLSALAKSMQLADGSNEAVLAALAAHDATRFLRELDCGSAELATEGDMTATSGTALLYVTPKSGDDTYISRFRGELVAAFRMEGDQLKVTGLTVKMPPERNPRKPDPNRPGAFKPNTDIAKPKAVEAIVGGEKRVIMESDPAAVPHWRDATPEQQKKADEVVAMLLQSAAPDAPGNLFNKATMSVQSLEDKKAAVPRVLNAMFELYGDVMGNNLKLSQLDRALRGWTGGGVNYDATDSADPARDKKEREAAVRRWFAFWYRYANGELKEFIEAEESLDKPVTPAKK
jgi:hypothetical protein